MRKKIYLFCITIAFIIISCDDNSKTNDKKNTNDFIAKYGIQTIDYEGCEYIIYKDKNGSDIQMLHKENCKYCVKKQVVK
ncbi:hypothetical protein [Polaribacter sp. Hel_I_88]|uniref:hypothetical protein n=1 Tax=Polaribacter sp. Hel_I_88 TaxID=1250006 RepID=UPI00047DFF90|nr:hypothetical protein [Polaribacter sp. Hel_I_88]